MVSTLVATMAKSKKTPPQIRVTTELHEKLRTLAANRGLSVAKYIEVELGPEIDRRIKQLGARFQGRG